MKKRKLKKKPFIILFCIILFIFGIIKVIDTIQYHKTYEYKLLNLNYSKEEVKVLNQLSNTTLDKILKLDYNRNISKLINEKYFLEKNLFKYLDYMKNQENTISDVISIINVGSNEDWYTNTKEADTSLNNLILVNKFYHLNNDYTFESVKVSKTYSYGENQVVSKDTWDAFLNMYNAAKDEDLTLIINSSYRSYEAQEQIYNEYKDLRGSEGADKIAARAGHSEHQTGMAIDIQTYGSTASTFEEFDEFKWLEDNAHKYGFILRYPKDKEYLTGYEYESWHYRYVGVDAATYIYENKITYDEYYAYFIEGNENEKKKN